VVRQGVLRLLWDRPGVVFVAGAFAIALAFPATSAGSIALAILAGAAGVALARSPLPVWLREPGWVGSAIVVLLVVAAGLSVFWETLTESPDWQLGDWGPQHAVLAQIMPSLPGFDVPVWNHALSTGDAPLELYPSVVYLVTGHVALVLGLEDDLPLAFMIIATLVHLALAVLVAVLAMRLASRKIAFVVAVFWVLDGGAVSHGGTVGLFRWAILHNTFAHVFSMIAVLGIVNALRRPRLGAAVTIWLGTAVATASHPAALLMSAACGVALAGVTLLASDVPRRRAVMALAHLVVGVALGAVVWLPGSMRLLAYGQHYSNELYTVTHLLQLVLSLAMPMTVYSLVVYVGYVGTAIGAFSRRAEVVFIALVVFVLIAGLSDAPYLGLGLAPSPETARLGVIRMMLLVRPLIYVAAAYGFAQVAGLIAAGWRMAPDRQRMIMAALLGIVGAVLLRAVPELWRRESQRAYSESRVVAADADGRKALTRWAHQQMLQQGPARWGRALFEACRHCTWDRFPICYCASASRTRPRRVSRASTCAGSSASTRRRPLAIRQARSRSARSTSARSQAGTAGLHASNGVRATSSYIGSTIARSRSRSPARPSRCSSLWAPAITRAGGHVTRAAPTSPCTHCLRRQGATCTWCRRGLHPDARRSRSMARYRPMATAGGSRSARLA
jgi:uncharacterized membrane protein YeaQ/YmgE (transglycosylase-associated protein family)